LSSIQFITSFLERKGGRIVFSSFFSKLITFIISVYIIRVIPKEEYGFLVYAITIIAFIAPFKGFGIYQGLLRYGSISKSQQLKKYYFNRILFKGLLFSSLLIVLLITLSPFIISNVKNSFLYLVILSFQLITLLIIDTISIYARLVGLNKLYADISNYNNLLLLAFAIPLTYLFGSWGYVASLIFAPLLYGFYLIYKLKLFTYNKELKPQHSTKDFLSYGFYMSLGGMLSQLLFAVDVILIGNMVKNAEQIAQYKTSNIIPFSLLVLPVAIINTDFVQLAQKAISNKKQLWNYYVNYLKIMGVVCVFVLLLFYFFSNDMLRIFGKEYTNDNNLMFIFSIGVVGALLFRNPLGNILSVIGWPKVNALLSLIILIINVIAGVYFINLYGVMGAAYTTIALMWLSGLLSLGAFIYFLNKK
jgi:O-antigen/teichoic acid export membrane protein